MIEKEKMFFPAFAGRWQKRMGCGVELRGVSEPRMGRRGGGYGWDGGVRYQGIVGLARGAWSFLET